MNIDEDLLEGATDTNLIRLARWLGLGIYVAEGRRKLIRAILVEIAPDRPSPPPRPRR